MLQKTHSHFYLFSFSDIQKAFNTIGYEYIVLTSFNILGLEEENGYVRS